MMWFKTVPQFCHLLFLLDESLLPLLSREFLVDSGHILDGLGSLSKLQSRLGLVFIVRRGGAANDDSGLRVTSERFLRNHCKKRKWKISHLKDTGEFWVPVWDKFLGVCQFHDHLGSYKLNIYIYQQSLTKPRADSELLIIWASFNVLPPAPVLLT